MGDPRHRGDGGRRARRDDGSGRLGIHCRARRRRGHRPRPLPRAPGRRDRRAPAAIPTGAARWASAGRPRRCASTSLRCWTPPSASTSVLSRTRAHDRAGFFHRLRVAPGVARRAAHEPPADHDPGGAARPPRPLRRERRAHRPAPSAARHGPEPPLGRAQALRRGAPRRGDHGREGTHPRSLGPEVPVRQPDQLPLHRSPDPSGGPRLRWAEDSLALRPDGLRARRAGGRGPHRLRRRRRLRRTGRAGRAPPTLRGRCRRGCRVPLPDRLCDHDRALRTPAPAEPGDAPRPERR